MAALVPFCAECVTADGFSVLVGGLCPPARKNDCVSHLALLKQLTLGQSRDCVVIDVQLSHLLHKVAPPDVRYMAASVLVPGATQLCGGVAGDLLCEESSADSAFVRLADGVFGFALPGACAMLMCGEETQCRQLYEAAAAALLPPLSRTCIQSFLDSLPAFAGQFLFVSDGSGGSAGCMYAYTSEDSTLFWLPPTPIKSVKRGEALV